jgi:hypothetical protein
LLAVSLLLGMNACDNSTASDANLDKGDGLDQALDVAAAIEGLRGAGAEVEVTGTIPHGYYRGVGTLLAISGEALHLYEFPSSEEAARESQNRPLALWATTPHFYQQGLVIGLYVGTTGPILDQLEQVLGEELGM